MNQTPKYVSYVNVKKISQACFMTRSWEQKEMDLLY
jgi:hypothetical protein